MDLSNLSPQDQQSFLALLGQQNQQTMDPSAFGVQPQPAAPAAPPQPPANIQQQDGDQMHPMDAISQIGSQMYGPDKPEGFDLATGPRIEQTKNGLVAKLPADHPLLRAMGVHQSYPVNEPNYFESAKNSDLLKYLPKGLAQMPDGTPFVGKTVYDQAVMSAGLKLRKDAGDAKNATYSSVPELTTQGFDEDSARALLAAYPNGVPNKVLTNLQGNNRLQILNTMAQARATQAGIALLAQQLNVGGYNAAQPTAQAANKNLGFVQRVQAAMDQVMANGGQADQRQRAEIATGIAGLVGNGASVITDQRMSEFLPQSLKAKYGNFMEMLQNERNPVDFTGFLPQLQDLVTREKQANLGISNAAQQLGVDIMSRTQPKTAKALAAAKAANPVFGSGTPQPGTGTPNPVVPPPSDFTTPQGIRQGFQSGKISRLQATALLKALGK